MKSKVGHKKAMFLAILLFYAMLCMAQVDRAALFGAYVYNFARYTTWPAESNYNNFEIIIIGNNQQIVKEISQFSEIKKLKGKQIVVRHLANLPEQFSPTTRMVVLLNDKELLIRRVNKMIDQMPIVLVTEASDDKRNVMFNVFDTSDSRLTFEINRPNILKHNISVDPEIVLLGGAEIDIVELYRSSQQSMDSLQKKMVTVSDSLTMLKGDVQKTQQIILAQKESIFQQMQLIVKHDSEIESDKIELDRQKAEMINQLNKLEKQSEMLQSQDLLLTDHKAELSEQQLYIEKQFEEISKGKQILDSLNSEVEKQHAELGLRSDIIKRQRMIILLTIFLVILALLSLLTFVRGYFIKRKSNKILTQQKEQIEKINTKLEVTNRSLYETIARLHETQTQLVSSEKMASLGVLTAGIAHEINNPVNFIYTGINSLRKDVSELTDLMSNLLKLAEEGNGQALVDRISEFNAEGEVDEILEIIPQTIDDIKVGAERAADIIKGLRNFSRIDKDTMQVADIHEGIDSSLLLLRNKFKNHIKVSKEFGELPMVQCYPGKLNQAFLNILSNAIDSIENEGSIVIRTHYEDGQVIIQFEDTGKGIAPEIIDKIFDPFFTTKSVGKGVGLGLSITYGIIQEHNGKINVKSELGSGTIFTILLPCDGKSG